ncbi:hypothetical protein ACGFJC_19305 [Nonomuraea fuscirosea]|uniref:hypothetical protein n=1 Tax=Nonomuraea fuscirosea TaxID=1291556 RepID=UPI003469BEEE
MLLVAVIFVGGYSLAGLLEREYVDVLYTRTPPGEVPYLADTVQLAALRLFIVAGIGLLSRFTSYRLRDSLLGLIPLYGEFLLIKLCWRAVFFPYGDWVPRESERDGLEATSGQAGVWLRRRSEQPG